MTAPYAVVVPTVGRASLAALIERLDEADASAPAEIVVVDDRPSADAPLDLPATAVRVRVIAGGGHGPAAARNAGWFAVTTPWVVFVDDDVLPGHGWSRDLVADLAAAADDTAAVQGRIVVPGPRGRPPTDDERRTLGLASARWITADMAVRRRVLQQVGGFDPGFPRAYREDSDLALRIVDAGHRIVVGHRQSVHPIAPGGWWRSVTAQRGNADDARMRARHGRDWRLRSGAGPGRGPWHVAAVLAGVTTVAATALRRRGTATTAAAVWASMVGEFTLRRVLPGPRTAREIVCMATTSVVIPWAAVVARLRGEVAARPLRRRRPVAVLFDRDGTLVEDVPYNADPARVRPVPGALDAVAALRRRGIATGVVSNQSGIARGLGSRCRSWPRSTTASNALLGPFDTWQMCPHGDAEGCGCRKPQPGMVICGAHAVGADPADTVVIGDIGSDVLAACAAGAPAILVPTPVTRPGEVVDAALHRRLATSLVDAVSSLLGEDIPTAPESCDDRTTDVPDMAARSR
ncbi:MAG: HAD-IIIA family hydrolase [Gordonia paraffinivorans]